MMETKLYDTSGKEVGTVKLNEKIFNADVNQELVWETVTTLLRNKRQGTASTKTRAEVRGGGRKPYRQKGIGWARHGSIRSPIWRGGGVAFGPKPRDYSVHMPKKKKMSALISSLSAKAKEHKIVVIEDITLEAPKTKLFADILRNANVHQAKTLVGVEAINRNVKLAGRNIPNVDIKKVDDINCYDILSAHYVLLTKKGLDKLEQRCSTKKS
jgi:large subunit ribosomal protein L4